MKFVSSLDNGLYVLLTPSVLVQAMDQWEVSTVEVVPNHFKYNGTPEEPHIVHWTNYLNKQEEMDDQEATSPSTSQEVMTTSLPLA